MRHQVETPGEITILEDKMWNLGKQYSWLCSNWLLELEGIPQQSMYYYKGLNPYITTNIIQVFVCHGNYTGEENVKKYGKNKNTAM